MTTWQKTSCSIRPASTSHHYAKVNRKIKHGAAVVSDHPALIGWYVHNKHRVATLDFEQDHMEGVSRSTREITFRLTSACNLRCKMCRSVESGEVLTDSRQSLPLEMWKSIVDDVARFRPYFTVSR